MLNYRFADLAIAMNCQYEIMQRRSEKYLTEDAEQPAITLDIPAERITQPSPRYRRLTPAEIELILMANRFAQKLLLHDGFVLHASAIAFQNRGILFSADSKTGKSTHTRLWQKHFGTENVPIINDDKPAIRYMDGTFYAYGNPFSGNSEENRNLKVPLHAIVFLEQAAENSIQKLSPMEALPRMLKQTLRPSKSVEHMNALLTLSDKLLSEIPCYLLKCNMDEEVVELVKGALF